MPPKSNVPIRICGSKTRSGCRVCKQRHIKCDERRPICQRCEKGDRRCVYDPVSTSSQSPRKPSVNGQASNNGAPRAVLAVQINFNPGSSESPSSISSYGPYQAIEIGAARHFATHLGKELAGCFSSEVWCDIVPRVAQYEPSIWHAVVAVGFLDASVRLGHRFDDGNPHVNAAIIHYSKSMRALNERLAPAVSTQCKDVILLSCILFAVFECLQNHYQSALRHITGGTKLLMEWESEARLREQEGAGIYLNHRTLKPVFLALDSQAVQLGAVDFREHYVLPAMYTEFDAVVSFSTTHEAHKALNSIFNRLARWTGCNECATKCGEISDFELYEKEKQTLQSQLAAWDSAFEALLQESFWEPATRLLAVQKKIMQIFFAKGALGPSEMGWDQNLVAFEEAVECAEAYMDLAMSDWRSRPVDEAAHVAQARGSRPVLTVAMDIVLPLYLISVKCRASLVRKRALKMLKICGRREGIWDSIGCAAVAEKIIQLEEEDMVADGHIPESARIFMLDIRFREDGPEEIVYKKLLPSSSGCGYEEVVVTRSTE